MCVGEEEVGQTFSHTVWFVIAKQINRIKKCNQLLYEHCSVFPLKYLNSESTWRQEYPPTPISPQTKLFSVFQTVTEVVKENVYCLSHWSQIIFAYSVMISMFFTLWGGAYGGLFRVRSCKSHSFLPSGGGNHHHSGTGMSWLLLHFFCAIFFFIVAFPLFCHPFICVHLYLRPC